MLGRATEATCDFPELVQEMALADAQGMTQGRAHEVFRVVIQMILAQGFLGAAKAFDDGAMGAMCLRLCQG
ncbi:MAG: hypothetical protein Q7T21_14620 [Gallionella sp.]|jgi:hypothetical protein|nr:hypothetical protein [Gallionella sp.]